MAPRGSIRHLGAISTLPPVIDTLTNQATSTHDLNEKLTYPAATPTTSTQSLGIDATVDALTSTGTGSESLLEDNIDLLTNIGQESDGLLLDATGDGIGVQGTGNPNLPADLFADDLVNHGIGSNNLSFEADGDQITCIAIATISITDIIPLPPVTDVIDVRNIEIYPNFGIWV